MMDFLPSYLYPNGERKVVEFAVSGISLGGHATWIALKQGSSLLAYLFLSMLSMMLII